jgi:hypothetical protein
MFFYFEPDNDFAIRCIHSALNIAKENNILNQSARETLCYYTNSIYILYTVHTVYIVYYLHVLASPCS